jgi:aminopeptidase-like protein
MADVEAERASLGVSMMELVRELYPICRSITGDGVRETLRVLGERVPVEMHEVESGTPVLDWTVPLEWNIRDAWIADREGRRVVDFGESNLHVVSYSVPVRRRVEREELLRHLHSLPEHPDWIPYRTSYYQESWGFCVTRKQLELLTDPAYQVCIDSTLEAGHLTYGELFLPGESAEEFVVSTHICHPSLCNDNLSGIAVSVALARWLRDRPRRLGVRFLYIPGTIGSITWLARNRERAGRIRHGLTLVCLGDAAPLTFKRTVSGDADVDRAAVHVLRHRGGEHRIIDFHPYGYDERQFNSPGFRIPVGSLMRGRHGEFPEYHTSGDNLDFIRPELLVDAYEACREIWAVLDANDTYRNTQPYGEPQLGRRGLYRAMGGESDPADLQMAMLWILNLSDGQHSLLDVAERSGMPFAVVRRAADVLAHHDLLEPLNRENERT